MSFSLLLSAHSAKPMYAQIVEQIVAKVMAGDLAVGAPLPSIRELASKSQTSVITVKRAYQELEHAGVIVTWPARGSFVAETIDPTRALAEGEFDAQLGALLETAHKLDFRRDDIIDRIDQALSGQSEPRRPRAGIRGGKAV